MYRPLYKYVTSTIRAIGYDIELSTDRDGSVRYALSHNGFLHSEWMSGAELDAFAHGVSRALHAVNGEWRIERALEEMAKEEEAKKAQRSDATTKKDDAAEGKEHHDRCSKRVEGHNEYVELEDDGLSMSGGLVCMFGESLSALDELFSIIEGIADDMDRKDK